MNIEELIQGPDGDGEGMQRGSYWPFTRFGHCAVTPRQKGALVERVF